MVLTVVKFLWILDDFLPQIGSGNKSEPFHLWDCDFVFYVYSMVIELLLLEVRIV